MEVAPQQDQINKLQEELDEAKKENAKEREAFEGRLNDLEKKKQAALQITPAQRATLEWEVPALQARVTSLENEFNDLNRIVTNNQGGGRLWILAGFWSG